MPDVDYEAATLAIREWMLWVAIAQVTISAIQTGIVYYGIRAMIRATDRRSRDAERAETARREAAEAARREADQRHAEAMQAGAERHAENMAAINAMAATLAQATAALKLVVERTEAEARQ